MSGRLFWFTAALLLGIAVHLAYILFVPRQQMEAKMSEFSALAGVNKLAVLAPEAVDRVLPEADPALAVAACVFDLSDGPVMVNAKIPHGYWLVSLYAPNGDSFYSLNSRQADVSHLDLVIRNRASAAGDQAVPAPQAGAGNRVTVRSPSLRGLLLLRARVPTPALGPRIRADLTASACAPAT